MVCISQLEVGALEVPLLPLDPGFSWPTAALGSSAPAPPQQSRTRPAPAPAVTAPPVSGAPPWPTAAPPPSSWGQGAHLGQGRRVEDHMPLGSFPALPLAIPSALPDLNRGGGSPSPWCATISIFQSCCSDWRDPGASGRGMTALWPPAAPGSPAGHGGLGASILQSKAKESVRLNVGGQPLWRGGGLKCYGPVLPGGQHLFQEHTGCWPQRRT